MAVFIRGAQDDKPSNAAALAQVQLGAPDATPAQRLEQIVASTETLKAGVRAMAPGVLELESVVFLGAAQLREELPVWRGVVPQAATMLVSNIPGGPKNPLYLSGGRLAEPLRGADRAAGPCPEHHPGLLRRSRASGSAPPATSSPTPPVSRSSHYRASTSSRRARASHPKNAPDEKRRPRTTPTSRGYADQAPDAIALVHGEHAGVGRVRGPGRTPGGWSGGRRARRRLESGCSSQRPRVVRGLPRSADGADGPHQLNYRPDRLARDAPDTLGHKPTLPIWGMKDPLFPPKLIPQMRVTFADHVLVELPDANHFIQEDAPDQIAEAIAQRFG